MNIQLPLRHALSGLVFEMKRRETNKEFFLQLFRDIPRVKRSFGDVFFNLIAYLVLSDIGCLGVFSHFTCDELIELCRSMDFVVGTRRLVFVENVRVVG